MSFLKPGIFLQEKDESLINPNTIEALPGEIVVQEIEDAGWNRLTAVPRSLLERKEDPDESYFWGVTPTMIAVLQVWRDLEGTPSNSGVVIVDVNMSDLPEAATGYFYMSSWALLDFVLTHKLTKFTVDMEFEGTDPPTGLMSLEEMREHHAQMTQQLEKSRDLGRLQQLMGDIHKKLREYDDW